MLKKSWIEWKQFYKTKFGIDDEVVELMANYQILRLAHDGFSIESIASTLDISEEEAKEIIINNDVEIGEIERILDEHWI